MRSIVGSGTLQSINAGEPTIGANASAATWTGAVKIAADADPTGVTAHRFTGIAKSDSSDTVAAAGYVEVWVPCANTIYSADAKTASLVASQALIDAMRFKRVVFDLTSTKWSVDTAASDSVANGLVILGGDWTKGEVRFLIIPTVSIIGQIPSA